MIKTINLKKISEKNLKMKMLLMFKKLSTFKKTCKFKHYKQIERGEKVNV